MVITICRSCLKKAVLENDDLPNEYAEIVTKELEIGLQAQAANCPRGSIEFKTAHCLNVCHENELTIRISGGTYDQVDDENKFTVSVTTPVSEIVDEILQRIDD